MMDAISAEKRPNHCDRQLNQKRQVKLKTCADVYEHWRSYKRLYKKAPKGGIEFQIDYIDTGLGMSDEERVKAPIALALHGAPGSYHDFSLLINHLAGQHVRVIAPNFPEYIATVKTKVLFRHSADEKAAYLRDFLKAIDVNKIDLLISHSSAIFPTLLILLNANNQAIAKQKQDQVGPETKSSSKTTGDPDKTQGVQTEQESGMTVNSFTQIGDQLGEEIAELGSRRQINQIDLSDSGILDSNSDDNDECFSETFEDAAEELVVDNNNNQNEISKRAQRLSDDLKQLDIETTKAKGSIDEHQYETKTRANDTKTILRRRRRNPADVIVQFEEPIEIRAVALFNPAGHRLPKSMKPTWFKCGSVHVYQHKFGRSLFRKFGPAFLTVVGVPVRVDNMDNVMLSATVMRNSKCQRVVKQLEQLSAMRIPTLLVFSENDKLIEKEIFYEMAQFMKLDTKKFDVFNNDGDIELSQSMTDDWIRVMVFKAGGHYAYSNYAKTVNKAVSDLLARITPTGVA